MNLHAKYSKYNLCTLYLMTAVNIPNPPYTIEKLKYMGFNNCFLEDENKSIENCILLVFQPSIEIYNSDNWGIFIEALKYRSNLIEIVNYNDRITGFWFKIEERFGNNLTYYFRKGKFSSFSQYYKSFLKGKVKQVVDKDKNYQNYLENELNLPEGILDNTELEEVPSEIDIKLILK